MLSNLQSVRERRMLWSKDIIELNKKIFETTDQDRMLDSVPALLQGLCGKPSFDESAVQAIALAAARFDALGSEDYETTRIQYILTRTGQNSELDAGLLRQIAPAILIHPSGMVSLQLKNGQIMKRRDLT